MSTAQTNKISVPQNTKISLPPISDILSAVKPHHNQPQTLPPLNRSQYQYDYYNRSPLSKNASPVYTHENTPPPFQYQVPQQVMYTIPYQSHPPLYKPQMQESNSDSEEESSHLRGNAKRKTRNNLPKETTFILLKWLHDHLNHPYPNSFEKNQLMMSTGLNQQQLSNWFINARRRKMKGLKEQKRLNLV